MKTKKVRIDLTGHKFEKLNLHTLKGAKGYYDELRCVNCGVVGKSYTLGYVELPESRIYCKFYKPEYNYLIRITHCSANGRPFGNLKDGSIHRVIPPPQGQKDKPDGVWVMGIGEPVKVLNYEFIVYMKRTK